ncbi:MAG: hypothetical protein Q4C47_04195, partial [Planctomycetia bacterium]|nr:hypothetical protein [Planctomycetia bacterium]
PVVLRGCCDGRSTWIVAINTAPFAVRAQIRLVAEESVAAESPLNTMVPSLRFSRGRQIWEVGLPGNTAETLRLASPDVLVEDYSVVWSDSTDAEFQRRIRRLSERVHRIARPSDEIPLKNPGFRMSENPTELSGWEYLHPVVDGENVGTLRSVQGSDETRWVRLTSVKESQSLLSEPFALPETGRLMVGLRLRAIRETGGPVAIPRIRLGIEATSGADGGSEGDPSPMFRSMATFDQRDYQYEWSWLTVHITDLPSPSSMDGSGNGGESGDGDDGLRMVRLRIDLTGPGTVELREVRLCGRVLTRQEQTALFKQIVPAGVLWSQRRVSDGLAILESGTSRWLERYPDSPRQIASGSRPMSY